MTNEAYSICANFKQTLKISQSPHCNTIWHINQDINAALSTYILQIALEGLEQNYRFTTNRKEITLYDLDDRSAIVVLAKVQEIFQYNSFRIFIDLFRSLEVPLTM